MAISQTQIQPPADWQDFERCSVVLWEDILEDYGIHRFGRGGQAQYGLDLMGYRQRNPTQLVGVQCKCIDQKNLLDAATVRAELEKALNSGFPLTEYFITHTGKNDSKLDRLAADLTAEQAKLGRHILIRIWGWETLQERIMRSDRAALEFDPSFTPFALSTHKAVLQGTRTVLERFERLELRVLDRLPAIAPEDQTESGTSHEEPLDREIDRYRSMIGDGRPASALKLLEALWKELPDATSNRIRFRVRANIGHSRIQLGEDTLGAEDLLAASDLWRGNEKSESNRILALLLLDRFQDARAHAEEALKAYPTSETIAAYFIQSLRDAGFEGSPFDTLPGDLRSSEQVLVNYVDFLRFHERTPDWWDAAVATSRQFPGNRQAELFAADATVDRLARKIRNWVHLSDEELIQAKAASDVLAQEYAKILKHDCPTRQDHRAYVANYIVSLCTSGDFNTAAQIVAEALNLAKDDNSFLTLAAQIGLEMNDPSLLDRSFPSLQRSGYSLLLACQIAARRKDWQFLSNLADEELSTLPESERHVTTALIGAAKAKTAKAHESSLLAEELVTSAKGDARASIVAANLAEDLGLKQLEERAFQDALDALRENSGFAARAMVAHFAVRKDLYGIVIRVLDGHVDTRHHSSELAILATAHAHAVPSWTSGSKFFESLPRTLTESNRYLALEGLYHYHSGDLDRAEQVFEILFERQPNSCRVVLLLAQTQGRKERSDESLIDLLKAIDIDQLDGSPLEKVQISQLLMRSGRSDDAIRLGYSSLLQGFDDPSTNLHYCGLVLMAESAEILRSPATVQGGVWVEITGPKNETNSFLIHDGPDRPSERIYGLSHQYALQTLGRSIGDSFTVGHPSGDQIWSISQIKSCYLHAFHDITQNFNARFPDHPGFWKITTQGDDISELLAVVRKQGENRDRQLRHYQDKLLPMHLLAGRGNVVSFMETVTATGGEIKTCQGTAPERNAALRGIKLHRSKGAVLDTLTFWTAVEIRGVDVLKAVFGKLVIARPTADELAELKNEYFDESTHHHGSTAYYNGQFIYTETTREMAEIRRQLIEKREAALQNDFEIAPVRLKQNPSPELEELISKIGFEVIAPALVAEAEEMMLITDDLAFRILSRDAFDIDGCWLHAVFMYAQATGLIDIQRYANLVAELAYHRHGFVSVDPHILEATVPLTGAVRSGPFRHLTEYLGSKGADMKSHLSVSVAFLSSIWGRATVGLPQMSATGLLLEQLTRNTGQDTTRLLAWLDYKVGEPRFREYLRHWKQGHFL